MNIFSPKDRQELQNNLAEEPDVPNSNTPKRKKITKNLTPYIVGIGLIVGLIIVFKVLKNDKTK